jgi:hypothetical protein
MRYDKNVFVAEFLNFFVWGFGYFYLDKHVVKGFVSFISYCFIWLFSILLILEVGYPLIYPLIFWVVFWSMWCGIFLAYDVYKISNEEKIAPLKIEKVKKVVRRSKVRAKRK